MDRFRLSALLLGLALLAPSLAQADRPDRPDRPDRREREMRPRRAAEPRAVERPRDRRPVRTRGEVRRGEMRRGEMRRGEVRRGEVRRGEVRRGEMRRGEVRRGEPRRGVREAPRGWEGRRSERWQQQRQRFREATPAERSRMRDRFERRLGHGPVPRERSQRGAPSELRRPVGEAESRELRQRLERMPEPERARIRDNAEHFRSLSDEDRNRLRGALRHLRELSPDERRKTLERLLEE
jgi:hypothetical protein